MERDMERVIEEVIGCRRIGAWIGFSSRAQSYLNSTVIASLNRTAGACGHHFQAALLVREHSMDNRPPQGNTPAGEK